MARLIGMRTKTAFAAFAIRSRDRTTAEGRSQERYRRIILTTVSMGAARAVPLLTALLSVPLTLEYLGTERYGLWMTISSFLMLLSFADMGIGNGLLSALGEADGRADRRAAIAAVSSAFFLLTGIAVVLAVVFCFAYPWIPWSSVFNVRSTQAAAEAGPAMAVLTFCLLAQVPLGIVERIQRGYQEGFTASLWTAFGHLLSLAGLIAAIHYRLRLPTLVFAIAGGQALASVLNGWNLFTRQKAWLRPRWSCFESSIAKVILRAGGLFFLIQIALVLFQCSDNLIVAQVLGPAEVVRLSVPMRLFCIAPNLVGVALLSLWPAYAEASARGDVLWVKRTLRLSLVATLAGCGIPALFLTAFGNTAIRIWVGEFPHIPLGTFVLIGTWCTVFTIGAAVAMLLNGVNALGRQAACLAAVCVVSVPAKVVFCQVFGVSGVILGMLIPYVALFFIPITAQLPSVMRAIEARAAAAAVRSTLSS